MNTPTIELIDSHAHLDFPAFNGDRPDMLERAREAGVTDIVLAGVRAAHWPRLRDVCSVSSRQPRLHPSYGLHPMFMHEHEDADLDRLGDWLRREHAVALGECGLDFHGDAPDPERQRRFLRHQLALARDLGLPVIVHARGTVEEIILILRKDGPQRGVVHSYSGSIEQARQLWALGMCIGLGGPVTHAGSHRLHRLVSAMPLEQLLLETDAPDQPGAAHRGERNEPAYLVEVLDSIARLRGIGRETVASATRDNARRLFGLR